MGTVRSAESIGRFAVELVADGLQIAIGEHDIGVKYEEVFAFCTFSTIVSTLSRTGVGLHEVAECELVGIFAADVLARNL